MKQSLTIWIIDTLCGLLHWFFFSIFATFIPFFILINWTTESPQAGLVRVFTDAILNGDVALIMVTLSGGLLGEVLIRRFYVRSWKAVMGVIGLVIFMILIALVKEFKSENLNVINAETAINITSWLFLFLCAHAISVIALSSNTKSREV